MKHLLVAVDVIHIKKNRGQCQVAKVWFFVHTFYTHFGDEEGSSKSIDIGGFPHPKSAHTAEVVKTGFNSVTIYISTVVYTQVLVYRSNIAARQCIGVYHVYIYPELSNQAGHVDLQRWWNHLSRCRLVSAMWFLSCVLRWYLNTIERVRHKNDTIYIYIRCINFSTCFAGIGHTHRHIPRSATRTAHTCCNFGPRNPHHEESMQKWRDAELELLISLEMQISLLYVNHTCIQIGCGYTNNKNSFSFKARQVFAGQPQHWWSLCKTFKISQGISFIVAYEPHRTWTFLWFFESRASLVRTAPSWHVITGIPSKSPDGIDCKSNFSAHAWGINTDRTWSTWSGDADDMLESFRQDRDSFVMGTTPASGNRIIGKQHQGVLGRSFLLNNGVRSPCDE